jgi:hypothetical protein
LARFGTRGSEIRGRIGDIFDIKSNAHIPRNTTVSQIMPDGRAFELRIQSGIEDLRLDQDGQLDPNEKENPIFQESRFLFVRFPPHQSKGGLRPKGASDGAAQNVFISFQIATGACVHQSVRKAVSFIWPDELLVR